MTAHAPGPWLSEGWSHKRDCSVISARGQAIAGAFYMGGTEQANANARLIAAAPTMYEYIESSASAGCATAKQILEQINGAR